MKAAFIFATTVCCITFHACQHATQKNAQEPLHAVTPPDTASINGANVVVASSEIEECTLMKKSDCYSCHHNDTKLVGPSFKEIAKKYPISKEHVKMLVTKIIHGGKGVWGELPMQAHSHLSETDVRDMVTYILTLDTLH